MSSPSSPPSSSGVGDASGGEGAYQTAASGAHAQHTGAARTAERHATLETTSLSVVRGAKRILVGRGGEAASEGGEGGSFDYSGESPPASPSRAYLSPLVLAGLSPTSSTMLGASSPQSSPKSAGSASPLSSMGSPSGSGSHGHAGHMFSTVAGHAPGGTVGAGGHVRTASPTAFARISSGGISPAGFDGSNAHHRSGSPTSGPSLRTRSPDVGLASAAVWLPRIGSPGVNLRGPDIVDAGRIVVGEAASPTAGARHGHERGEDASDAGKLLAGAGSGSSSSLSGRRSPLKRAALELESEVTQHR